MKCVWNSRYRLVQSYLTDDISRNWFCVSWTPQPCHKLKKEIRVERKNRIQVTRLQRDCEGSEKPTLPSSLPFTQPQGAKRRANSTSFLKFSTIFFRGSLREMGISLNWENEWAVAWLSPPFANMAEYKWLLQERRIFSRIIRARDIHKFSLSWKEPGRKKRCPRDVKHTAQASDCRKARRFLQMSTWGRKKMNKAKEGFWMISWSKSKWAFYMNYNYRLTVDNS